MAKTLITVSKPTRANVVHVNVADEIGEKFRTAPRRERLVRDFLGALGMYVAHDDLHGLNPIWIQHKRGVSNDGFTAIVTLQS